MPRESLPPLKLARLLQNVAEEKNAWDPVLLDVRDKTTVADYFVICEGETDRQLRAIADAMLERAREAGLRPLAVDGYEDATWILLDFDSTDDPPRMASRKAAATTATTASTSTTFW